MTLRQAEEYLVGLELFGMRLGLDRMRKLTTAMGSPQRQFASVHVVGSNGKSSTVRMIAAILERHGIHTGTYTSPHLRSFVERIEVGGRPVSGTDFAAGVARVARAAELVERTLNPGERVTQFEALTAAAYHQLARHEVDVAVVEAGLGGRYDATNVIPSTVQVLTSVSLEHVRWLGSTVAEIAREKLAVVPQQGTLVVGELPREAESVARRTAFERRAVLVRARAPEELPEAGALAGAFQRRNLALAVAAAEALLAGLELGELDAAAVREATAALSVPGRLEIVAERPLVIYDAAHNSHGAAALAESLGEVAGERPLTAVVAVLDDKDAAEMLRTLLPRFERVVFTRCAHPRSLAPSMLANLASELAGTASETAADPHAAMARARELAGESGAVLATGSIYLIADLVRSPHAPVASAL